MAVTPQLLLMFLFFLHIRKWTYALVVSSHIYLDLAVQSQKGPIPLKVTFQLDWICHQILLLFCHMLFSKSDKFVEDATIMSAEYILCMCVCVNVHDDIFLYIILLLYLKISVNSASDVFSNFTKYLFSKHTGCVHSICILHIIYIK